MSKVYKTHILISKVLGTQDTLTVISILMCYNRKPYACIIVCNTPDLTIHLSH